VPFRTQFRTFIHTVSRSGWRLPVLATTLLLSTSGCVHHIHVAPEPDQVAADPIPLTVRVEVPLFVLEGADHMSGIALLKWPWQDFRQAVVEYIQKRRSFTAVGTDRGDVTLSITAKLALQSHDRYIYHVRLDSQLVSPKFPSPRTYVVETEAVGSSVRWVTASDQDPIAEAVRLALNELLTKIEADRAAILAVAKP
jgi:hypothetical protein